MSTARSQVARLMAITPYLRAQPEGVPLSVLAAEFDVPADTMRKDLQVLVMCGLPELLPDDLVDINLEAFEDDSDGLVRISNADFMPRPTRLASGEAASLMVALESMRVDSLDDQRVLIDQLRSKLELASIQGGTGKASVLPAPRRADLEAHLRVIEQAVTGDRQLRLNYLNATRDELSDRVVDPVGLLKDDNRNYLDAWCHSSRARRLFRADRIQDLTVLETAREHTDLSVRTAADGLFDASEAAVVATLRLQPDARWIAGYHPVLTNQDDDDGSLVVTLQVSNPLWLVRTVLSLAPDAEVLEPAEYVELVRAAAQASLTAYDETSWTTHRKATP